MLDIIKIIAPIFGIIFFGFFSRFLKLINEEQLKAMGMFAIKIALPCLLIINISSQQIDKIWQPTYLFSYSMVSFVMFISVLGLYRYRFKQPLDKAALMALGSSASNTGFIGSAILHFVLGSAATVYFAMTLIIENFIVFLMFLLCLEVKRQQQQGIAQILLQTLNNILKNPIIISLVLGITISVMQFRLPSILQQVLEPIGKTAGPIGLFVVGGSLYGINGLNNIWRDGSIIFISKMVLMPLLVYLMFLCMPNTNAEMIFAGVLLASVSMATLFGIFGQSLGVGEKSSAILLICTLANILSVTTIITLLLPNKM